MSDAPPEPKFHSYEWICDFDGYKGRNQTGCIKNKTPGSRFCAEHQREFEAATPQTTQEMEARAKAPVFLSGMSIVSFEPPKGQKPTNPKNAFATNKAPLGLISGVAQVHESLALMDGGCKYGIGNIRAAGVRASIYMDACLRHLTLWFEGGERVAGDSGVHHLGHARACLGIILDAEAQGVLVDDRPMSNQGLAAVLEEAQQTAAAIRARHADKNPRHFTIADNGTVTDDPKVRGEAA